MSHDVVVTNCCQHGPVWYSNETRNLDQKKLELQKSNDINILFSSVEWV